MPQIQDKFVTLLQTLFQATQKEKVQWEDTVELDIYRTWVGDGAVRIGRFEAPALRPSDDEYAAPSFFYRAWLLNANGEVVDEIECWQGAESYTLLKDLFNLVRRRAKNVDQLLDNMLNNLRSKE
ncbi:MAG: hypothetical protein L0Y72_11555 [Gemmataceae bacterium]|nr:hypothetical protein [Gemmataceae bacterium]MCI0739673.1 hypothetical protein [Gemmataceae bacterium]